MRAPGSAMRALKPVSDRARVLYAALSLNSFTVAELAKFSGVNLGTVQTTVSNRDAAFFTDPVVVPTGKPGGQTYRYTLTERARERLKEALKDLPRGEQPQPASPSHWTQSQKDEQFLIVLNAARGSLERARS